MVFKIRQRIFSIRGGFYITDENDVNQYYVRGKIFSIGKKLHLEDLSGNKLILIAQRLFRIMKRYDLRATDAQGNAQTKKPSVVIKRRHPLGFAKNYKLKLLNPATGTYTKWRIKGNAFAWNFTIIDDQDNEIAYIDKKLLHLSDSYKVDVRLPEHNTMCIAAAIAIDMLHHNKRRHPLN